MKKLLLLLAVLGTLSSVGCTTSLTNVTPTRALEPKEVEVSVRGQIPVHGNIVRKTIASGKDTRDVIRDRESEEPITEEQLRNYLDASLAWFLFRPGFNTELSARIGLWEVLEGMDLGLRWDFTTVKGDLKLQVWENDNGKWAFSALAGVGKQAIPVPGAVEWLSLTKWSRTDFDFMLSLGFELPDILHVWFNPRFMLSTISVEHKLPDYVLDRLPDDVKEEYDPNKVFENELMTYVGGTVGGMVGYKYAFLALEMTVMQLMFEPTVLGQERDFDSLVVAPAAGLVVNW